jgi:hypothetical protein
LWRHPGGHRPEVAGDNPSDVLCARHPPSTES